MDAPGIVDDALGEIVLDGVGWSEIGIEASAVSVVRRVLLRSAEKGVAGKAMFIRVQA